MKNTIYLDGDFNFLLLENEEEDTGLSQTKIYINIPTSDATNQELEISVAGGAPITESIPSSTKVNFELSQQYWADNGDVEITPKNDDITGDTITIHFPETFTVSAALNYLFDDEFEIVAQNEDFAEGGSGSGSGSGGGSAFDFVETIRNIGFRLLDEPSNVNAYFDEIAEEVQIKWTDPADISTNEPAPAEWAGTVVVRKEGSAPLHRWDGDLIVDSTTRDQYASSALVDNTLDISKNYYYGIFPYDTKGDYRFTKVIAITSQPIPAPQINSLVAAITSITVNYSVNGNYTYDYITIVYKKNSAPASKTDGTAVSLSASDTSKIINGLDEETTYYFKIFAQVTGAAGELESNTESTTTGIVPDLIVQGNANEIIVCKDTSQGTRYANVTDGNWHTFSKVFDTPVYVDYVELYAVVGSPKVKDIKLTISGTVYALEDLLKNPDISHCQTANAWNFKTLNQYFDTDYNLALLPLGNSRTPTKSSDIYSFANRSTACDSYYEFKLKEHYLISAFSYTGAIEFDGYNQNAVTGVRLRAIRR